MWIFHSLYSLEVQIIISSYSPTEYATFFIAEIIARLEQSSYSTNESVGQLVICVLVEGRPSNRSVALQIMSLDNHSAEGTPYYFLTSTT